MRFDAVSGEYCGMRIPRALVLSLYPLCLAAVAVLSLIPKPLDIGISLSFLDKVEHGLAYMTLGFLGCLFFARPGTPVRRAVFISVIIGLVLGVMIEFIQPSVGRSCEFADALVDFAALVIGCAVFLLCPRFLFESGKRAHRTLGV